MSDPAKPVYRLSSLRRTFELVEKRDLIVAGGEAYADWIADLATETFCSSSVLAVGGVIVPQLGMRAGEHIALTPRKFADIPPKIEASIHRIQRHETQDLAPFAELRASCGSDFCLLEILLGADPTAPIGRLWVMCLYASREQTETALQALSTLIRLAVSEARFVCSLSTLASNPWVVRLDSELPYSTHADTAKAVLRCSDCVIWLCTPDKRTLEVKGSTFFASLDMPMGQGLAGTCGADSKVIRISDFSNANEVKAAVSTGVRHAGIIRDRGWRSGVFFPLDLGGEVAGVLAIYSGRKAAFNEIDVQLGVLIGQRLAVSIAADVFRSRSMQLEDHLHRAVVAIDSGAMIRDRIHDAKEHLLWAQSELSFITHLQDSEIEKAKTHAKTAATYIKEAQGLTRKLTDLHRLMREPTKRSWRRCRLRDLIQDIVDNLAQTASGSKIVMSNRVPAELEADVDTNRFDRLVWNLLSNAIYALTSTAKHGRKEIVVSGGIDGKNAWITIWDNGPGIELGKQVLVFNDFYTTNEETGMGLGLGIARSMARQHKGSLTLKSEWGVYTEFKVEFPIQNV